MNRSQIALHALLACAAVLCHTTDAKAVYSQPGPTNPLERRIENARNGDWTNLLRPAGLEGEQLASVNWNNGGGHKFKNSRGKGKWSNGKGGGKWSNSRPTWRNGGYYGGWRNGGYYRPSRPSVGWGNGGGGFINW